MPDEGEEYKQQQERQQEADEQTHATVFAESGFTLLNVLFRILLHIASQKREERHVHQGDDDHFKHDPGISVPLIIRRYDCDGDAVDQGGQQHRDNEDGLLTEIVKG